jgi:predicted cation transporter
LRRLEIDALANIGLLVIFALVLILPFRVKCIEHNLEIFLFACGVAALTLAGLIVIPGEQTGWSVAIVQEALLSPLHVTSLFGIPIGIVQIVLVFGLLIYFLYHRLQEAIVGLVDRLSLKWIVFLLIVVLGLVSSIISAILAAIILVEIINALPVVRKAKVEIAVVSCFSIGLGAGLTPLGEPLTTIVVSKLSGAPYHAGFTFLFDRLAIYIIPTILLLGVAGVVLFSRSHTGDQKLECIVERETIREILIRAGKVYLFIMALVFLGEGLSRSFLSISSRSPPQDCTGSISSQRYSTTRLSLPLRSTQPCRRSRLRVPSWACSLPAECLFPATSPTSSQPASLRLAAANGHVSGCRSAWR